MGHYALSAIKGLCSQDYITWPGRARDQAQDSAQEEPATMAEVMSARHRPGEGTGQRLLVFCQLHQRPRTGKLKPVHASLHSRDAVCIHQGASTVCSNLPLSHKMSSLPHWHCVSFTKDTDAWAYHCWAQPGAPLPLRVCDIQITNSFGHTLYFCCSVWSIPTLVQA